MFVIGANVSATCSIFVPSGLYTVIVNLVFVLYWC